MLAEAEARSYGTHRNLERDFINWQRCGLMGMAVAKAPRRGGEGLWTDRQLWIWLSLLHLREQGAHLRLLANVPVGSWMVGMDGIDIAQIQRVLASFWSEVPAAPSAERSPAYRSTLDRVVERLSAPGAQARARRQLRREFARIGDELQAIRDRSRSFVTAVEGVLSPQGKPTPHQSRVARDALDVMAMRALAVQHIDRLARSTNEAREFWAWTQRFFLATAAHFQITQPELASHEGVGHVYNPIELQSFLAYEACTTLLLIVGIGIDCLWRGSMPNGLEAPPPLSWVHRAPRTAQSRDDT
jgi:hypothetical protein